LHMRIDEQFINIIPKWVHEFTQDHVAYKHINARVVLLKYFFPETILKTTIDFDFCCLSFSSDIVYKKPRRPWQKVITDLFYDFVRILLV
jgi:hypothetical protein